MRTIRAFMLSVVAGATMIPLAASATEVHTVYHIEGTRFHLTGQSATFTDFGDGTGRLVGTNTAGQEFDITYTGLTGDASSASGLTATAGEGTFDSNQYSFSKTGMAIFSIQLDGRIPTLLELSTGYIGDEFHTWTTFGDFIGDVTNVEQVYVGAPDPEPMEVGSSSSGGGTSTSSSSSGGSSTSSGGTSSGGTSTSSSSGGASGSSGGGGGGGGQVPVPATAFLILAGLAAMGRRRSNV